MPHFVIFRFILLRWISITFQHILFQLQSVLASFNYIRGVWIIIEIAAFMYVLGTLFSIMHCVFMLLFQKAVTRKNVRIKCSKLRIICFFVSK